MDDKHMKSDEVRKNWADVLQYVRTGGTVVVEHYTKPIARIVPDQPDSSSALRGVRPSVNGGHHSEGNIQVKLVNLTPHPLTLIGDDGSVLLNQPPDGPMARCAEDRRDDGTVTLPDGATVPLRTVEFGTVTHLPAPRDGILYVVSRATAEAATGRNDVVYPDEQVRDNDGRIIGCRALARAQ